MTKLAGVNVPGSIVPLQDIDSYATHSSQYGKGGWREVASTTERDAITDDRLNVGMAVYVTSENKVYIYKGETENQQTHVKTKTWEEFSGGSSGATWGSITGTLSSQSDLNTALNGKADTNYFNAKTDVNVLEVGFSSSAAEGSNNSVVMGTSCSILGTGSIASDDELYGAVLIGNDSSADGNYSVTIGDDAKTTGEASVAIGSSTYAYGNSNVSIGDQAVIQKATETGAEVTGAVQLGHGTNNTSNTLQFRTYQVIDANGHLPKERLTSTTPSTGQVLAYNGSGMTWINQAVTSASVTIAPSDWNTSTLSITKTVSGVSLVSRIFVSPAPSSMANYVNSGVYASAQRLNGITFKCSKIPTSSITVYVAVM